MNFYAHYIDKQPFLAMAWLRLAYLEAFGEACA